MSALLEIVVGNQEPLDREVVGNAARMSHVGSVQYNQPQVSWLRVQGWFCAPIGQIRWNWKNSLCSSGGVGLSLCHLDLFFYCQHREQACCCVVFFFPWRELFRSWNRVWRLTLLQSPGHPCLLIDELGQSQLLIEKLGLVFACQGRKWGSWNCFTSSFFWWFSPMKSDGLRSLSMYGGGQGVLLCMLLDLAAPSCARTSVGINKTSNRLTTRADTADQHQNGNDQQCWSTEGDEQCGPDRKSHDLCLLQVADHVTLLEKWTLGLLTIAKLQLHQCSHSYLVSSAYIYQLSRDWPHKTKTSVFFFPDFSSTWIRCLADMIFV